MPGLILRELAEHAVRFVKRDDHNTRPELAIGSHLGKPTKHPVLPLTQHWKTLEDIMSYGFMGFGFFLSLPILICQWVGVLALGKAARNGAWWWMMAGITCTTVGTIISITAMGLAMAGMPLGTRIYLGGGMMTIGGLAGLGSLLFTIGFALHGLRAAKSQERIAQLEAIAAAQSEELNRFRAG